MTKIVKHQEKQLNLCTRTAVLFLSSIRCPLDIWPDVIYKQKLTQNAVTLTESRYNLLYIKTGELKLLSEQFEAQLAADNCYAVFPDQPFRLERVSRKNVELLGIRFDGDRVLKLFQSLALDHHCSNIPCLVPDAFIRLHRTLFDQLGQLSRAQPNTTPFAAIAQLFELLDCLSNKPIFDNTHKRPVSLLEQAMLLMDQQNSKPIGISQIAEQLGISQSTFERLCRKHLGSSPLKLLNQRRIRGACLLLKNTDLKIRAIATECGFQSDKHFIRKFKSEVGQSPGKYRNNSA